MNASEAARLLAGTELFSKVADQRTLVAVAERCIERNYKKGHLVFCEGDQGDSLFVLVEGLVKVVVTSVEGDEMVLVTLTPPASFGELALVDGRARSASVEVVEPSKVLVLGRSDFLALAEDDPALTVGLLRSLAGTLRRLTDQASDFVFLDLEGRVCKLLVGLAEAQGGTGDPAQVLDLQLTQGDLARMVGGSRQSVNQILRSLAHRGCIELTGRTLVIRQADSIRRRAGL